MTVCFCQNISISILVRLRTYTFISYSRLMFTKLFKSRTFSAIMLICVANSCVIQIVCIQMIYIICMITSTVYIIQIAVQSETLLLLLVLEKRRLKTKLMIKSLMIPGRPQNKATYSFLTCNISPLTLSVIYFLVML